MIKPKFVVRIRVENDEIVDLAGNMWTASSGISISDDGIVGAKSIASVARTGYMYLPSGFEPLDAEDFTISAWVDLSAYLTQYTIGTALIAQQQASGTLPPKTIRPLLVIPVNSNSMGWSFNNSSSTTTHYTANVYADGVCYQNGVSHVAWCRKGGALYIFLNGKIVYYSPDLLDGADFNLSSATGILKDPTFRTNAYNGATGRLDDICIIKGKALWTEDFIPPTDYLSLPEIIYLSNDDIYGVAEDGFKKLATGYSELTDEQKIDTYNNVVSTPTTSDIYTLDMPVSVGVGVDHSNAFECNVIAIPHNQVVEPTTLTTISLNFKIDLVHIASRGNIKVAITKDGSTYQVYNFMAKEWSTISIDDIATKGMSCEEVSCIPDYIWEQYNPSQLGFAFYASVLSVDDVTEINKIGIYYVEGE